MAEVQRRREKEKKEKNSVDILTDVLSKLTEDTEPSKAPELEKLEFEKVSSEIPVSATSKPQLSNKILPESPKSIVEEIPPSEIKPGVVDPKVKPILPAWVDKPWRWMVPEDINLRQQWLMTWGDFILDFARVLNFHILDLQEISVVYPFRNSVLRKKLSITQLVMISEHLIGINKAKWWDDERTRLRVYWKTLKNHAEDLYDYAFQNGYDMVTAFDIVKMKQSWSSLPPSDIRMLMSLMVEMKRALWADTEKKTIQFIFE